ncbi:Translation initiation factor eIF-4A [uncultured virus]|nr:Translation initiation factor eIF-4A [uncultured virus]
MNIENEKLTNLNIDSFEKIGLKENILRGVFGYGFEKPSEIQSKAIFPIINGKDIIAQSQSGTGKTGAFVISCLQRIDENLDGCQALIISPTRELAFQIMDVCKNLGSYTRIKPVLCVGGLNIQEGRKELESKPIIVIGTPGRVIDMIEKKYLTIKNLKLLILDEADEMLSNSFMHQIKNIIELIPNNAQICLFSATMPKEILDTTTNFLNNPEMILIKQEELTLDGIRQFYINVDHERWKLDTLSDLYDMICVSQSIIYVNTRQRAHWLKQQLEYKNFPVSVIHSKMTPLERTQIMKEFRNGSTRILLSTDLLARGIDIQQVSIVINYDLPHNKECYIHRIGRSGRFGRKGVAINFVTRDDNWRLTELKKFYNTEISEMPNNIDGYL